MEENTRMLLFHFHTQVIKASNITGFVFRLLSASFLFMVALSMNIHVTQIIKNENP